MSWFKKIFSNIMMDDIEVIEQRKQEKRQPEPDKIEMKTRMTYEYPKGQFRFPLIQEHKDREPIEKKINRRSIRAEQRPKIEEKDTYEQTEKPKKNTQKIKPQSKRPFKPEVIPSPIYGFKRPEKFAVDEQEEKKMESPLPNLDGRIEEQKKINHLASILGYEDFEVLDQQDSVSDDITPLTKVSETMAPDGDLGIEENMSVMDLKTDEDSSETNVEENREQEQEGGTEEVQQDEVKLESQIDELVKITEEHIDNPDRLILEHDDIDVINQNPLSDEFTTSEASANEIINHDGTCDEEEQMNQLDLKLNEDHAEANKEKVIAQEQIAATVSEELLVEEPPVQKAVEERDIEEEKPIPNDTSAQESKKASRKHIPFNVLMLKKDRQELEIRNQKNKEERKERVIPSHEEKAEYVETINQHIYQYPDIQLLEPPVLKAENSQWIAEQTALLDETLTNFNVNASVVKVSQGPSVTRFEVQPERGVKVSKIKNLTDDIKLSMAAKDIRMEAPIPGKRSIGIELPNHESRPVQISEIIGNDTFKNHESPLTAALGLDISGIPVVTDLSRMPHGLIAGATGSGKSVCINSILVSLLYKARPDELKLLLIDPKMVELTPYNDIPHLVSPVITDVKAATAALKWAVDEMERRYELFAHASVRDISRFNELVKKSGNHAELLPFIVVVIDELADLMMMAPADVEESICRIAQKARACGIHLIIATQRPSVDVITGLIKANVPARIAFSVSSQVDSRTIIDISGAEKLLGRGDMLFLDSGTSKPVRLQGTFVSDDEIDRVIAHARSQGKPNYLFEQEELLKKAQVAEEEDELFMDACDFVVEQGSASTSLLQRHFRIGYNRAARLVLMLEQRGIISEPRGSKPRDVLIDESELEQYKDSLVQ
ncbi:DNA translocase FtsK [Bacillus sp. FSL K6-3431]|uniref:DNA translocase FtsK n=1 Tax=Bacillus sp. FSL K6-3431 TaxID=2921500 RepID=UPI0030F6541D